MYMYIQLDNVQSIVIYVHRSKWKLGGGGVVVVVKNNKNSFGHFKFMNQ